MNKAALEFERVSQSLESDAIVNVYYQFDVEGFVNTREIKKLEFEYIPLSKLILEMASGRYFTFFDSSKFLENQGYYTLDIKVEESLDIDSKKIIQSEYNQWTKFLNEQVSKVDVLWDYLYNNFYQDNPSDLYPKGLEIKFSEHKSIVIAASELEIVSGEYNFMCPDEALIVFFSRKFYDKHLGVKN
ncbi:hypothetical protein [Fulvivirga lutea]|uniref:Uncharacterized protein n=1 Tax=Fulvivirga lutea TaxID=2810512 RepID=A0A975A2U3_9BACT|nr:hypothetical protein [Fulvivirga lutea]QSE99206.1 hypothetical protein JR347_08990 [Fulvivirga lutea]